MTRENVRLNNFILWCKGWYEPVSREMDIYSQVRLALKLDGYDRLKTDDNAISIINIFIDDMVESKIIKPIRLHWLYSEILKFEGYGATRSDALIIALRNYFAYNIDRDTVILRPPIYNRSVYKLGFTAPKHFGNTYKMQNDKANKFFKMKRTINTQKNEQSTE